MPEGTDWLWPRCVLLVLEHEVKLVLIEDLRNGACHDGRHESRENDLVQHVG